MPIKRQAAAVAYVRSRAPLSEAVVQSAAAGTLEVSSKKNDAAAQPASFIIQCWYIALPRFAVSCYSTAMSPKTTPISVSTPS